MPRCSLEQVLAALIALSAAAPRGAAARDEDHVLSLDHTVRYESPIPVLHDPSITPEGPMVDLFVRERVLGGLDTADAAEGQVVLFIGTGADAADVLYDSELSPDYGILSFLAQRGFDAFSMDLATMGRSTRPSFMDVECNLRNDVHQLVFGFACAGLDHPTPPVFRTVVRSSVSDLADVDRVVDYLRDLRHVDRVHVAGFSSGARLAGQYALRHPDKVDRLVLIAPNFAPPFRDDPPSLPPPPAANAPAGGPVQARAWLGYPPLSGPNDIGFLHQWPLTQTPECGVLVDTSTKWAVWSALQATDAKGAEWGLLAQARDPNAVGFVRTTATTLYWWSPTAVLGITAPTLIVAGELDGVTGPDQARSLYAAMVNAERRVVLTVACASHYVIFERQRGVVQEAIQRWLVSGTLEGVSCGEVRADPDGRIRREATCSRGP
jgi:pimeloyl-ACP methyl ester carboxylesterase